MKMEDALDGRDILANATKKLIKINEKDREVLPLIKGEKGIL